MAELTDGPATRYARSLSTWERNDWWRVEARAWERHQPVRFALAFFSPAEVWKDLNRRPERVARGGCCLGVVVPIAALCLPVLAMLGSFGWVLRPDRTAPILMVGLMCLVAVFLFTRGLISDLRNPERVEAKSAHIVSYLHLVPSSITLVVALSAWAADKVDAPPADPRDRRGCGDRRRAAGDVPPPRERERGAVAPQPHPAEDGVGRCSRGRAGTYR